MAKQVTNPAFYLTSSSTVAFGGTGYAVGNVLELVGGTSTAAARITVATVTAGVINTFTISFGGVYSILPNNPVTLTTITGTGTGASINASWVALNPGFTAIQLYGTNTSGTLPPAGTLTNLELFVDTALPTLYVGNSGGMPIRLVGTLGAQNSTNVSITGGSINNTPIGLTTPSSGAFSSIRNSSFTAAGVVTTDAMGNFSASTSLANLALSNSTIDGSTVGATNASSGRFNALTVTTFGAGFLTSNASGVISSTTTLGMANLSGATISNSTISGGTINGAVIGSTNPAAGSFTGLTVSGFTSAGVVTNNSAGVLSTTNSLSGLTLTGSTLDNSAVGANTASTGRFTSLTHTGFTTAGVVTNNASGVLASATSLSGLALNSTSIGATTASTGRFTGITHTGFNAAGVVSNDANGNLLTTVTLSPALGGTGLSNPTGYVRFASAGAAVANATIPNSDLANSSITIGTTVIALGASTPTLSGVTSIDLSQDPQTATQAARKGYVDAVSAGTQYKASVVAATTVNITLSGLQTIDGVAVTAGQRVLVKNQTDNTQNGIYDAAAAAWARSSDSNTAALLYRSAVLVTGGTTQSATGWSCTIAQGTTLGSTPVPWIQSSASQTYAAGSGLQLTGTVFSVLPDGNSLTVSGAGVRLSATYAGQNTITTLGTVTTGVWNGTTIAIANGGTGATTQQTALNALSGAQTNGRYLRSDGTNVTLAQIQAADVPTLNQSTTGTASNVTGVVAILNGGTGATTQQTALNALAGAVTSGRVLRGDGTNVTLAALVASDIPTLNQNTTGTASNVTGVVALTNGGTGQTTRQAALNALVGAVTANNYLKGDGTNIVLGTIAASDIPTLNQNTTGTAGNVTGVVAVANGGTGQTSLASGNILVGNGTAGVTTLAPGANGTVIQSNGTAWVAQTFTVSFRSVTGISELTSVNTTLAATQNIDIGVNNSYIFTTNATASWVFNFRWNSTTTLNATLAIGETVTCAVMVNVGTVGFIPSAYQIDGAAITPKWLNGIAPLAGAVASQEVYNFTITKTASAVYNVNASRSRYY